MKNNKKSQIENIELNVIAKRLDTMYWQGDSNVGLTGNGIISTLDLELKRELRVKKIESIIE